MPIAELIIVLALLQFLYFGILVGRARGTYGVQAPAVSGSPIFERYFRVQMNTLELLVMFVPGVWLAPSHVASGWVAVLGAIYLLGRSIYQSSYVRAPERRSLGFGLSMLPILALLLIDFVGAVRSIIAS